MLKSLSHWWLSRMWTRAPPFLNWVAIAAAMPNVATLKVRAIFLAAALLSFGIVATRAEPTSGTAPMVVNQGKLLISGLPLELREEDRGDQSGRSSEHGQGAGADEPVLEPSQAPRGPADQRGQAVDRPVHAAVVGVDQGAGQVLARTHQGRLVEGVAVQVLAGRHGDEAAARGDGRHLAGAVLHDRDRHADGHRRENDDRQRR